MLYIAGKMVALADLRFLVFLREDIDPGECGSSCGIEASVIVQCPGEVHQTQSLSHCITEPLTNFRCFSGLLHSFFEEAHYSIYIR